MLSLGIRQKLMLAFGGIVLMFALIVGIVFSQFRFLISNSNWTTHTYEVLSETDEIQRALRSEMVALRDYMLTGDANFREILMQDEDIEAHFSRAAELTSDNPAQQARLKDLVRNYAIWKREFIAAQIALRQQINRGEQPLSAIANASHQTTGTATVNKMLNLLSEVEREEQALLETRSAARGASEELTTRTLIIGTIVLLAGGFAIAWLLARNLVNALGGEPTYAKAIAEAIAEGNLAVDIQIREGDDSSLLATLKKMNNNLKSLVLMVQANASNLQSRSESLALSAQEINKSTSQQSFSTGNMAASVEELTVSINSVSQSAQHALTNSNELAQVSVEGESIIYDTLKEMSAITNLVNTTSTAVADMSESSKQISNVIEVIREVTEQTNLLALNAAIEAARAGEMGRGFSVVADEVRKLAEKTSDSANEIADTISKVRHSTDEAVKRMSDVVESVHAGESLAQNAGMKISSIQEKVKAVTEAITHISIALQEQSQASYTISESVENIAQMTEENAAATKATSETAEQLLTLAGDLNTASSKFVTR